MCLSVEILQLQIIPFENKKHLKNVGPIRHCEPPHADVHNNNDDDDDNDNAWQRGPLWPHRMGPMINIILIQVEDERRAKDEATEQTSAVERRVTSVQDELEELRSDLESAERARKAADSKLNEANEQITDLTSSVNALNNVKRKLENDVVALQVPHIVDRFSFVRSFHPGRQLTVGSLSTCLQLPPALRPRHGPVRNSPLTLRLVLYIYRA